VTLRHLLYATSSPLSEDDRSRVYRDRGYPTIRDLLNWNHALSLAKMFSLGEPKRKWEEREGEEGEGE
jgi:hypothetical protein